MCSELLDYIILALIFLITIKVLMDMLKKQNAKEKMDQIVLSKETTTENTKENGPIVTPQVNNALDKMLQPPSPVETVPMQPAQPAEVVEEKSNKFTKQEILDYQDSMFEFNENINRSSSSVDMVDKINQLYTQGNNEMAGLQGKKISEIYDGLTQGILDRKKQCINPNCLLPPIVDNLSKIESYIMSTDKGKYFRHGLMYEDDSVQTGAKFYNDIEASDSEFEQYSIF